MLIWSTSCHLENISWYFLYSVNPWDGVEVHVKLAPEIQLAPKKLAGGWEGVTKISASPPRQVINKMADELMEDFIMISLQSMLI